MAASEKKSVKNPGGGVRRICVALHRDLGFFFAGIIVIYALSGIFMNHRRDANPSFTVEVTELTLPDDFPTDGAQADRKAVDRLVDRVGETGRLSKHYFVGHNLKILLKGGSSMTFDMNTRRGTYERVRERPLISGMVKLHYNPGRWWTAFSDIFAVSLIVITLTGLIIIRGRKGIAGRGAIELVAGLSVPIIFLLW